MVDGVEKEVFFFERIVHLQITFTPALFYYQGFQLKKTPLIYKRNFSFFLKKKKD